jgi:peptidoglycan/xylan/chitin deacetylase (PgdA/CDA1 family)
MVTFLFLALAYEDPSGLVRHGLAEGKRIALTFDACQAGKPSGYDRKVIATLRATHTKATLFLGGAWMKSHQAQTKVLGKEALFEIGSHSAHHPHMTRLSEKDRFKEIDQTQAIQRELIGREGKLFRPPYGEFDEALVRLAAQRNLRTVLWSIVSGDPDPHVTAKRMTTAILAQAKPGAIIIMHMNGRGWHTAEALPGVIAALRKRGFQFVTVSEILAPQR